MLVRLIEDENLAQTQLVLQPKLMIRHSTLPEGTISFAEVKP
jgi:hypothetical protein